MLRMANARDFKRALRTGRKSYHKVALVFSLANDLDYPRLGIIVARRRVPRAVDRNRIKRIVRESFRLERTRLANADYVVMMLEAANALDRHQLARRMQVLWQEYATTDE